MNALRLLVISFVFAASACGKQYNHFTYEPNIIKEAPKTTLRIAVLPFEDKRETKDSGSLALAYVPLVPTAKRTIQQSQKESDAAKADYYYPGLIAYSIAKELKENGVGAEVHLSPAVTEHYDLIIHGTLDSLELSARRNTYGLSVLGALARLAYLPSGSVGTDVKATYMISDIHGNTIFSKQLEGEWSSTTWSDDEAEFLKDVHASDHIVQQVHGIVNAFKEISGRFLKESSEAIKNYENEVTEAGREMSYYSALDQEVSRLISALSHSDSPALRNNFMSRRSWLEPYRQTEWSRLVKEQELKDETIEKRLNAIAAIRHEKRSVLKGEKKAIEAQRQAAFGALSEALSAGIVAANYRSQLGYGEKQNLQMLGRDVGMGLASAPVPQIPTFPTDRLLDQIDTEMEGLEGVGYSLRDVRGNSVQELRRNFLHLYRRKFGYPQRGYDFVR